MTEQVNNTGDNIRYKSPQVKVVNIATRNHILQSSLYGSPGVTDYEDGSNSNYGFGDED